MGEYKLINLTQDYYNDITADELKGLYSLKNKMLKKAWVQIIQTSACVIFLAVSAGLLLYFGFDPTDPHMTLFEYWFDILFVLLECIIVTIQIISFGRKELDRWSDFYFGKGKIIAIESEFIKGKGAKHRPDGFYRHTLTIAVSDTEAVGNIFYFSDKEWDSEKYMDKSAAAVYFPRAHLLYAVIDGEDAEKYSEEFCDMMFVKRKRKGKFK